MRHEHRITHTIACFYQFLFTSDIILCFHIPIIINNNSYSSLKEIHISSKFHCAIFDREFHWLSRMTDNPGNVLFYVVIHIMRYYAHSVIREICLDNAAYLLNQVMANTKTQRAKMLTKKMTSTIIT